MSLRVAFAGTPEFARVALQALHDAGFKVPLVLTQPDRPAGRGMKLQASSVKQWAIAHGMEVLQPRSLRLDGRYAQDAAAVAQRLQSVTPDVLVVAAYGLILPSWILELPRWGCLNIHASLLPRWRGAAPIHRAIEAGDAQTGITIMQMDAGLDTGAMLLTRSLPISAWATTDTLHDELAQLGGELIVTALHQLSQGVLQPVPQPQEGVTYAHKIDKAEAVIDWSQSATVIERRIRAFDPFPGATLRLNGETIKLWSAHVVRYKRSEHEQNGQILSASEEGVTVVCGQDALILTEMQRAGAKRLLVREFLRGFALQVGQCFECNCATSGAMRA